VLRTHQVRSDLQRISVIRLSGAGVWTNTREASPITMLVPMAIPMFDLNSTGSMALARPRPAQRATRKPSGVSLAVPEGSGGAVPVPLVNELPSEPEAEPVDVADMSQALAPEPEPTPSTEADHIDSERGSVPEAKQEPSVEAQRIDLIIDSLTRHELIEAIPVTVESLGDTVFTATVHSLNLTGTGNTLGEALIIVKDQLEIMYEKLSKATGLDDDEKKYLKYLQSHIKIAPAENHRHSKRSLWR
jgi:hypothetical protein